MTDITAILIDPFERRIVPCPLPRGDDRLDAYYAALSHETMPVDCFTTVHAPWMLGNDALFVDDEGLFKNCAHFIKVAGFVQPLAGKGLLIGADRRGNSISARTPIETVRASIGFYVNISVLFERARQ